MIFNNQNLSLFKAKFFNFRTDLISLIEILDILLLLIFYAPIEQISFSLVYNNNDLYLWYLCLFSSQGHHRKCQNYILGYANKQKTLLYLFLFSNIVTIVLSIFVFNIVLLYYYFFLITLFLIVFKKLWVLKIVIN